MVIKTLFGRFARHSANDDRLFEPYMHGKYQNSDAINSKMGVHDSRFNQVLNKSLALGIDFKPRPYYSNFQPKTHEDYINEFNNMSYANRPLNEHVALKNNFEGYGMCVCPAKRKANGLLNKKCTCDF